MNAHSSFSGTPRSLLSDNGVNGRSGLLLFGVSLILHLVFLAGILLFQGHHSKRILPPAIHVNLVSFASVSQSPPETAKSNQAPPVKTPAKMAIEKDPEVLKEIKVKAKEKEPAPVESQPEVSVSTKQVVDVKKKPVKKKSLKSKTYQPEKVLDNARRSIEKSVEKEKQDTLNDALARLKEQVKKETAPAQVREGIGAGPSTGSGSSSQAIDLYNLELMYKIQQNWAFNERLAGADKDIEVRILIKILKNGQLRDIWFETRSGNKYLDESALKAVKKSTPFSPLPKGYQFYDVGLIFTPSGLK